MTTKTVDSKGRITLGKEFAGRTVSIRKSKNGQLVIEPVTVIPEQEAWLYKNPKALASVRRGLRQAKAGKFVKGPDLGSDSRLADSIPE